MLQIYHNPRCSKSRQALEILKENGFDPEIILYLQEPPSVSEIKSLLKKLDKAPIDIIRSKEKILKEENIVLQDKSAQDLVNLIHQFPILLERPIVVHNNKAIIGRPPESVLSIL